MRLFEHPVYLLIVLVIVLLLFGAPKLPGMARSLGQSMRIFKSEVDEMKTDKKPAAGQSTTVVNGQVVDQGTAPASPGPAAQDVPGNTTQTAPGTTPPVGEANPADSAHGGNPGPSTRP